MKFSKFSLLIFFREGNEPADNETFTYKQMLDMVIAIAKVLRGKGVKKGDRVAIYLPMVAELPAAMLACARIGAVHSVVVRRTLYFLWMVLSSFDRNYILPNN